MFFLAANSSNPEQENVDDNQMYIHIPLSVTADWKVTGKSEPATLEYNISEPLPDKYIVEDQLGPEVVHIYDVKNKGPATIKEAVVFIMWPSFTQDDERHLLYLFGVSTDPQDQVTCQPIQNINPLYIKVFLRFFFFQSRSSNSTLFQNRRENLRDIRKLSCKRKK